MATPPEHAIGIGACAENVVIHDHDDARRSVTSAKAVATLQSQGYSVYVFAGQNGAAYQDIVPQFFLRKHMPIDSKDLTELLEAKGEHDKVAAVLHGVISPGGKVMNRLLRDEDITVVSVTRVPAVRGDHRYGAVWTEGKGWWRRSPAKGFEVIQISEQEPPSQGWFTWAWGS